MFQPSDQILDKFCPSAGTSCARPCARGAPLAPKAAAAKLLAAANCRLIIQRIPNYPLTNFEANFVPLQVLAARDHAREEHRQRQKELHHSFHPVWGQLMKTGYQNSRFAHQVERFACLYTSHVANLCYYSPDKSYRTQEDIMPHEVELLP